MNQEPQKRCKVLQSLSCEHHHSLLLCWKIRTGFKKGIEAERIKKYINCFWETHLKQHFEMEEKFIFPILGNGDPIIKKALAEHRRLKRLFESPTDIIKNLSLIEEELENHIRFEERVLFDEIQRVTTDEQLQQITFSYYHDFTDNSKTHFGCDESSNTFCCCRKQL